MGDVVIVDTSIFIDHLRSGRHDERIQTLTGLIRTSSVVLSELWRGATKPAEQRFLRLLARNHPILTPTQQNWQESGEILVKVYTKHGFTPDKLRDLHFDALIALTARSHGGRVITSNRADFELLRRFRQFDLETW
jgi:predicted nucleic acid-binding protein